MKKIFRISLICLLLYIQVNDIRTFPKNLTSINNLKTNLQLDDYIDVIRNDGTSSKLHVTFISNVYIAGRGDIRKTQLGRETPLIKINIQHIKKITILDRQSSLEKLIKAVSDVLIFIAWLVIGILYTLINDFKDIIFKNF